MFPKIVDWIFDMNSNKNQVKWTVVSSPMKTKITKGMSKTLKYAIIAVIPPLILLLIKIVGLIRARTLKRWYFLSTMNKYQNWHKSYKLYSNWMTLYSFMVGCLWINTGVANPHLTCFLKFHTATVLWLQPNVSLTRICIWCLYTY